MDCGSICIGERMNCHPKNLNMKKDQNGQALLFVIVAMTVALTVGIAVSSRTVSSVKRTSSSDTASRVLAASEGGIEWFLKQDDAVLTALANPATTAAACTSAVGSSSGYDTATGSCKLVYTPQADDLITSTAYVKVETFTVNDPANNRYWFEVNPGDVKEMRLSGYTGQLTLCWKSLDSAQLDTGIYYLIYSKNGVTTKKILAPSSMGDHFSGSDVGGTAGAVTTATSAGGYAGCSNLNIAAGSIGVRMKSLYAASRIVVTPAAALPVQGFKITSTGQLGNAADKVTAVKVTTVYRSYRYAPSAFDYALYSPGSTN
jgi:hypothetical protein